MRPPLIKKKLVRALESLRGYREEGGLFLGRPCLVGGHLKACLYAGMVPVLLADFCDEVVHGTA